MIDVTQSEPVYDTLINHPPHKSIVKGGANTLYEGNPYAV
jgi:hypothetical protein